ncbi:MAG: hypothetical protein E6Q83_02340 [Thiothrix sp.]|nr:MAG: hypothetical protein E6Q83_02340 [Thiothrix sp.]
MGTKLSLQQHLASSERKLGFVFANRYRVTEFISDTSLSQLYWAEDIHTLDANAQATRSILVIVNPALLQIENFALTLARVLPEFATTLPAVIDSDFTMEGAWFLLALSEGIVLEQQIKPLGRHGFSLIDTLRHAEAILGALRKTPLNSAYGYLEVGSILQTLDKQYLLLNTPIAATLKILSTSNQTKSKLSLSSSFISPEVAMGNKPTEADDTFSLAALIYYMLNGHLPFVLDNSIEAAIKKTIPATVIKLPEHRWQALARALAYKREQRQANPDHLLSDLNNLPVPQPSFLQRYGLALALLALLASAYGFYQWWALNSAQQRSHTLATTDTDTKLAALKVEAQRLAEQQQAEYVEASQKLKDIQQQQVEAEQRLAQLLEQQQQLTQQADLSTAQPTNLANDQQGGLREQRLAELEAQQKQAEEALKALELQEQQTAAKRQLEQEQQAARAAKLASQMAEQQRQKEAAEAKRLAEEAKQRELEKQQAEAKRLEEAQQKEFAKQQAEAEAQRELARQQAEQQRLAEEAQQRELARQQAELAAAQQAEQQRLANRQRQQAEAEARRLAEETQQRELAAKQAAEAQRLANLQKQQAETARQKELQRQAEAKRQEEARKREQKRQSELANLQLAQSTPIQARPQPQNTIATTITVKTSTQPRKMVTETLAVQPSPYPPQLVVKTYGDSESYKEVKWDNTRLFGSVPTSLQEFGNRLCKKSGMGVAIGYHPKALDENAKEIDGGGYLCK